VSGTPDVLIVGGGVIGCAIAHYLTKGGARVTIVERRRIAQEASWASAGLISPPKQTPHGIEHARLEARSFGLFPALLDELQEMTGLSVEHCRSGRLSVARDEDEIAALEESIPWQRNLGFVVEWLDGDAVRREEPALGPAILGGVWCAAVSSVRAHRLTAALARSARLRGATILEHTPVEGFLTEGGRVRGVRTRQGDLRADVTVVAAGAWTAGFGALLDLPLPTRPVRGQMLALADADPPLRHAIAGAGGYLIPRADGTVAVAATVEDAGFDTRVTPEGLAWLAGLIGSLAPAYTGARIVETWAGLRPGTADDLPILGRAPGYENLWVAAGHLREGVIWAPITGELLAGAILSGEADAALAPYDPARFGEDGRAR
jgi:glycine oxidase